MADASVLGIHPPNTIRIDWDGFTQDWPFETVAVGGDELVITTIVGLTTPSGLRHTLRRVVFYPYEHARQLEDGTWVFHGRQDFTVTAGPPQPLSLQ